MDRTSSESSSSDHEAGDGWAFEETYPRYEFAELVRLVLAVGAWLAKTRPLANRRPDLSSGPLPGQINPAE